MKFYIYLTLCILSVIIYHDGSIVYSQQTPTSATDLNIDTTDHAFTSTWFNVNNTSTTTLSSYSLPITSTNISIPQIQDTTFNGITINYTGYTPYYNPFTLNHKYWNLNHSTVNFNQQLDYTLSFTASILLNHSTITSNYSMNIQSIVSKSTLNIENSIIAPAGIFNLVSQTMVMKSSSLQPGVYSIYVKDCNVLTLKDMTVDKAYAQRIYYSPSTINVDNSILWYAGSHTGLYLHTFNVYNNSTFTIVPKVINTGIQVLIPAEMNLLDTSQAILSTNLSSINMAYLTKINQRDESNVYITNNTRYIFFINDDPDQPLSSTIFDLRNNSRLVCEKSTECFGSFNIQDNTYVKLNATRVTIIESLNVTGKSKLEIYANALDFIPRYVNDRENVIFNLGIDTEVVIDSYNQNYCTTPFNITLNSIDPTHSGRKQKLKLSGLYIPFGQNGTKFDNYNLTLANSLIKTVMTISSSILIIEKNVTLVCPQNEFFGLKLIGRVHIIVTNGSSFNTDGVFFSNLTTVEGNGTMGFAQPTYTNVSIGSNKTTNHFNFVFKSAPVVPDNNLTFNLNIYVASLSEYSQMHMEGNYVYEFISGVNLNLFIRSFNPQANYTIPIVTVYDSNSVVDMAIANFTYSIKIIGNDMNEYRVYGVNDTIYMSCIFTNMTSNNTSSSSLSSSDSLSSHSNNTSTDTTSTDDKPNSKGKIIGSVLGSVFGAVGLVSAGIYVSRRGKKRNTPPNMIEMTPQI